MSPKFRFRISDATPLENIWTRLEKLNKKQQGWDFDLRTFDLSIFELLIFRSSNFRSFLSSKRSTVIESLSSYFTKDRSWSNRSRRYFLKIEKIERSKIERLKNRKIFRSQKNDQFDRKTEDLIPNPAYTVHTNLPRHHKLSLAPQASVSPTLWLSDIV